MRFCFAPTAIAAAHAEEDCGDIERNYELIKAEAVSVQINMALFAAADRGCEPLARKLLEAGGSLLGPRPARRHAARPCRARAAMSSSSSFFLAGGAPVDARNVDGGTALFAAADGRKAFDRAAARERAPTRISPAAPALTPLIAAAFKGNDRIVEDALAHGADPNARDATGKTAMVYAAARGFDDIVRRLLDAGVDANGRVRQRAHRADVGRRPRRGRRRSARSSGSSIFCSRTARRSTPPTIAAAPR